MYVFKDACVSVLYRQMPSSYLSGIPENRRAALEATRIRTETELKEIRKSLEEMQNEYPRELTELEQLREENRVKRDQLQQACLDIGGLESHLYEVQSRLTSMEQAHSITWTSLDNMREDRDKQAVIVTHLQGIVEEFVQKTSNAERSEKRLTLMTEKLEQVLDRLP